MNVKTISRSLLGGFIATALLIQAPWVQAAGLTTGTLSGQVGVQLTIGSGCTVTNGSSANGVNSWGTIDFGTYSDLINAIDSKLIGSGGANAVSIVCSNNLPATLTLNNGLHMGAGTLRKMESANGDQIAYRLYSNSTRQAEFTSAGIGITGTGTAQEIPIYARVLPADQGGVTAPATGFYQDMVTATLTW
ncbi:Csu type fimbrial protein [Klebsiella aerogenes]|uniref:Csu type fimbrial protein n=1 Tax=Klebsiella TaxID=570 RepID=UPI000B420506|nr:spore coat protein U domain-containing protein [Klebsiella aerogenes]EKZ9670239.1 spore coat U domain-containing protein [Klebsiella aerogenes]MDA3989852.1 spore coat protein U domain-containing protein [Klebsiella aerogenes]MDQ8581850.1 spore coat protein U domain-containing protein [Klebsiella aerogenes]MEB7637379.1 spore coat U domain-containing protein [Klebsiella aerogenes]RNT29612.1 spore coat U domain-containing protein [Klebsiella aerogenes]